MRDRTFSGSPRNPFDDSLLFNTRFEDPVPLKPFTGPSRPKSWRGSPFVVDEQRSGFGVRLRGSHLKDAPNGKPYVQLGLLNRSDLKPLNIGNGAKAVLAQEVRSPFAGSYVLKLKASGDGSSRKFYEEIFLKQFRCKLIFFQFTDREKSPKHRMELASIAVQPKFAESASENSQEFVLEKNFVNTKPGSNFSFGLGLGVAVIVEKISPGTLELTGEDFAFIRVNEIEIEFAGKKRNDKVTV